MASTTASVLFLCNRNSIRSPIAEALLKQRAGHRLYIDSVGLVAGEVDPFVLAVMGERGIDLATHRPKSVEEIDISAFDLLVSLAQDAHRASSEITRAAACEHEFWDVEDPSDVEGSREVRLAAYRALRDRIAGLIAERFPAS